MTSEDFGRIDRLHVLLDVAVQDGERALAAEDAYDFDAAHYHTPGTGICYVGADGVVMAGTLGAVPGESAKPRDYPEPVRKRLQAVDHLRCGNIEQALFYLGVEKPARDLKMQDVRRTIGVAGKAIENWDFVGREAYGRFLCEMREQRDQLRAIDL